jgi:hypothetical protein
MEVVAITILILALAQAAVGMVAIKKIKQIGCEYCNPNKKEGKK